MDSLTHAFSVLFLAEPLGCQLAGFGIIGTVLPDMDIFLHPLSRREPRMYIFSHGGITHSIPGAFLLSITGFLVIGLMQTAGFVSLPAGLEFWILGLAVITGGSLLHIGLDYLAYPGIPLFYPFSDRKYTLGVFPGPSLFLTGVSIIFLLFLITGVSGMAGISSWGLVFVAYIALNLVKWGIARYKFRNEKVIPTFHPLRWIQVREKDDTYVVGRYSLTRGVYERVEYKKAQGIREEELKTFADDPEMRRIIYFSYFTVAEKDAGVIRISDPLRISGLIQYPPYFREISIKLSAMRD
ncbi:MAG: metal-dependent hydrolase [Methanolinea sp. SDB]|nr:MAG: metal-dependent hydrolase [Methanolinea sp. SDB]